MLDFGVARLTDSDIQAATLRTDVGQIVGTLPYMSPEQVSGDPDQLDTRSDVYALGVVLYELLTERLPYQLDRRMVHEAIRIIREEEPTRLSSLNRTLRGDIETIVGKALEKDKERRYATAAALAADIRRYLADEPIAARPPSTLYQVGKFVKRNKVLVSAAAGVFLAVLAGFIVSLVLYFQADAARRAAIEAQRRAEREAAKQRSVNALVQRMLDKANRGRHGGDPNITVRQVMDAAASELEGGRRRYEPEVEVAQRETIGHVYFELGLFEQAERMMRAVIALRDRDPDAEPVERAASRSNLATLLNTAARYDEALALQEEALDLARRALGSDAPEVSMALNNLADIQRGRGAPAEAERLHREALALRRAAGQQHFVAESLNNLASALVDQGRGAEAEPLYREALALSEQLDAPDEWLDLHLRQNLGALLAQRGRVEEALPLLEYAAERRATLLGPDHPEVGVTLANLGSTLRMLGRSAEAERYFRQAQEAFRRTVGPTHPDYAISLNDLALVLNERGELEQAEALWREALAIFERDGCGLPCIAVLNNLGRLAEQRGEMESAEAMLERAVELARAKLGTEHTEYGRALNGLAAIVARRGDHKRSENLYRESLAVMRGQVEPEDWRLGVMHYGIARALVGQSRLAEAHKPFRFAARAIEGKPGVPPGLARDLNAFGDRLYDELDKLDPNGSHADAACAWRARRAAQREVASSQPGD